MLMRLMSETESHRAKKKRTKFTDRGVTGNFSRREFNLFPVEMTILVDPKKFQWFSKSDKKSLQIFSVFFPIFFLPLFMFSHFFFSFSSFPFPFFLIFS